MICSRRHSIPETQVLAPSPLPSAVSSRRTMCSDTASREIDLTDSPPSSRRFDRRDRICPVFGRPLPDCEPYRALAVLSGHVGSVSCLALCGEFLLSASQGKEILVWQLPEWKVFATFGQGEGSVKAVVTAGDKVFTAHQDSRIRVWRVSRNSGVVFKHVDTLPTRKDYLGKCLKRRNYVQTRRHHKHLWIEHADSISCLTVGNGVVYSGSWDKTLKVWSLSDLRCLESIVAHDDAIHGLVSRGGMVYSASADGRIKAWGKEGDGKSSLSWRATLEGHRDVSLNSVVVSEDGRWVYGGGSDGFVLGWEGSSDLKEWRFASKTKAHRMAVLCMATTADYLFSGSADKTIGIWKRRETGEISKVGAMDGHEGPVKCLQASSPRRKGDGVLLYSGGFDKSLRVWWVPRHPAGFLHDRQ